MAKKNKKPNNRINNEIRAKEVRIVGDNIENSGEVVTIREALDLADNMGVDLIEINNADIPICKILDYKKYLYDLKKKQKDQEKKQKENAQEVKELRFGPNTDEHDYNFKLNHAEKFLEKGDILKATVFFKGREIQFTQKGIILLLKLADDLSEFGIPDNVNPRLEGRKMTLMIRPKKNKK